MPHWAQRARLRARRDHEFRSQGSTGPRFQTHSQRSVYPEAVKPELPLTDPATLQEEFHRSLSGFPDELGRGGECAHAAEAARWPRPVASSMQQMPPGACCASAGESRWGRARPTKRAGRKEDRAGPHIPRPAPAPPRPGPPPLSLFHLGSPLLLLPISPALCSPKDLTRHSHGSRCPASTLPGLCTAGLAPAPPACASASATSAGCTRDAWPTTRLRLLTQTEPIHPARLISEITSSRKPPVYPTHLPCSPRSHVSSLGPVTSDAYHYHECYLTRLK